MTPQELKNSVLQLAIQGRLVEQRPEEGTAGELFAQIQEEKQRLVQEGKIKANKKIEPISDDTIPFDIPDSWVWIRFGNLVNYSMGKTPPRAESEWWGGDIPWVSIADMPESGHLHETKESVTPTAFDKKFGNKISPAGTLLMSFKLTVGRVSILDVDAVHNEAIISIHPLVDDTGTEKMYLFYILPFISQFGESKNAIKGKTLNDASISNLLIPLPPLSEQKRIVAKIEELLPLVDRYEAAWTRLEDFNRRFPEDMKKSILQHAIQGKLVEQRPEEGTAQELYEQIQAEKRRLIKEGKIKKEKPLPEITEDEISVPFLLVYCSVNEPSQCYYLWLQEYIRVRLNYENPKWRTQGTNTVYFPKENLLGTPRAENHLTYIAKFPKYQQSWVSYYLSLNDLCYDMPCVLEDVDLWAKEDIDALVEPAIKKLETGKTKFGNIPNRFIPDNYDTTIELGRTILSKPNSDGEQLFMFICNCQRIQRSVEMIVLRFDDSHLRFLYEFDGTADF